MAEGRFPTTLLKATDPAVTELPSHAARGRARALALVDDARAVPAIASVTLAQEEVSFTHTPQILDTATARARTHTFPSKSHTQVPFWHRKGVTGVACADLGALSIEAHLLCLPRTSWRAVRCTWNRTRGTSTVVFGHTLHRDRGRARIPQGTGTLSRSGRMAYRRTARGSTSDTPCCTRTA